MAIAHKKKFTTGLVLFLAFWVTLVIGFLPIFGDGRNMLDLTDDLFNRVSKDSSYYIPDVKEEAETEFAGHQVSFTAEADTKKDPQQVEKIKKLFDEAGATATVDGKQIKISGDLGVMTEAIVEDSNAMFENNGSAVQSRYGYDPEEVMFAWWTALDTGGKDLTRNDEFDDAKNLAEINEKAVEPAYNYYGIEADSPGSQAIFIVLSLAAYITYTVWYGFSLLFMFEGWGLKLDH
jgi:hypothetical protein